MTQREVHILFNPMRHGGRDHIEVFYYLNDAEAIRDMLVEQLSGIEKQYVYVVSRPLIGRLAPWQ